MDDWSADLARKNYKARTSDVAVAAPDWDREKAAAAYAQSSILKARLADSARQTQEMTPDQVAKAVSLSQRSGESVGAVLADLPEFEARALTEQFWAAPQAVKTWLAEDPANAALAKDSLNDLSALENIWGKTRSLGAGMVGDTAGGTLKGLGDLYDAAVTGISVPVMAGLRAVGADGAADVLTVPVVPWWLNPSEIVRRPGQSLKATGEEIDVPPEQRDIVNDIFRGVGQVGGQVAVGVASGGLSSAVSLGSLLAQGADQMADRAAQSDASAEAKATAVLAGAGVTALTERIGLGVLLDRLPPNIRNGMLRYAADLSVAAAGEASQEVVEAIGHNMVEKALLNADAPILEDFSREAIAAGGTGAIVRGLLSLLPGRQHLAELGQAEQAKQGQAALAEAAQLMQTAQMAQQSPEKMAEVLARITGGGSVSMPADQMQVLYQSGVINDVMLEDWGVADQVAEAAVSGGDVDIPADRLLQTVRGITDPAPLAQIIQHIRLAPAAMTAAEADAVLSDPDRQAKIDSLIEEFARRYDGEAPGQAVYDDVAAQVAAAGRPEREAKVAATIARERLLRRAEDRGMDPDALYAEERMQIRAGDAAPAVRRDDLDLLLERLRTGNTVQAARTPVLDILRGQGGVAPGSPLAAELEALGITRQSSPGLFRRGGLTDADTLVISEHDVLRDNGFADAGNGYADPQALLEAIGREWAGSPLTTAEDAARADRLDAPVQELAQMLDRAGLDPKTVTKAEVETLLGQMEQAGDGKLFAQGPFGPVFTEFRGNAQGAIAKLMETKDGEAVGALYHPDIGEIDLVWGKEGTSRSDGFGLAKLVKYHPEVLGDLQGILSAMTVVSRSPNRVNLESSDHRAGVRLTWDGYTKQWLMTAFRKKTGGGDATTTDTGALSGTDDTASRADTSDDNVDQTLRDFYQSDRASPRGTYAPDTDVITLFRSANPSTVIHEMGHRWLFEMTGDLGDSRLTETARRRITADLQALMDHMGVKIDVAASTPEQIRAALSRDAHETFARMTEAYFFEGRAQSKALAPVMARLSAWLIGVYRKLRGLNVTMTPEVRAVFDRLLATDDAIAEARDRTGVRLPAALKAVLPPEQAQRLEDLAEQAALSARATVQGRVMKELARTRRAEWKEEYARLRAEVTAEVRQRPVYAALGLMQRGESANGTKLTDDSGKPRRMQIDRAGLVREYGEEIVKFLPRGTVAASGGMNHHILAGLFGYDSFDTLRRDLMNAAPIKEVIDAETEARMRRAHGDLTATLTDEAAALLEADDRRLELVAAQAKALRELAGAELEKAAARTVAEQGAGKASADRAAIGQAREDTDQTVRAGVPAEGVMGPLVAEQMAQATAKAAPQQRQAQAAAVRQVRDVLRGLDGEAIAEAARRFLARRMVKDATNPDRYRTQADRLDKAILKAVAARDYAEAAALTEQKALSLALAREAEKARQAVEKTRARLAKLNRPDSKLAGSLDVDFLQAARSVAARFGLARAVPDFDLQGWRDRLTETDPAGAADILAIIDSLSLFQPLPGRVFHRTSAGGRISTPVPWESLSYADFRELSDGLDALLEQGQAARTAELNGEKIAIDDAVADLTAQVQDRIKEDPARLTRTRTTWEKTVTHLQGMKASLLRFEHFARMVDGDRAGAFTRLLHRPVLAAVYRYRDARTEALEALAAIINPRKADLLGGKIWVEELDFEFQNKGQLLHAILHSGNDSNLRKLLIGWEWGRVLPGGGFDRSRWDAAIARLSADGTLTKQDFDTAQAVWDLLDRLKGPAQQAHRALKGYYFKEVEPSPVVTPWGSYRGGYVPALTDPYKNEDTDARLDADALAGVANASMFPAVARGFTKARSEGYAKALDLNLMRLPSHIDSVVRFSHLAPVIRQTARIVSRPDFKATMHTVDPAIIGNLITPWLQRTARQTVDTPTTGSGGRAMDAIFRKLRRGTSLQAMVGNVLNAAQQVLGPVVALADVKAPYLMRALVHLRKGPDLSTAAIHGKSAFMRQRAENGSVDAMQAIESAIEPVGALKQARNWVDRHGYFAQTIVQNWVDRVVWLGAYDQATAAGLSDADAVAEADSSVRRTQGSFAPEDISRAEGGSPLSRLFTMFYGYFNTIGNLALSKADPLIRQGRYGALLPLYLFTVAVPSILAEAIMQAARGGLGDDDDDGMMDDMAELFLLSQVRYLAALVPFGGSIANYGIGLSTGQAYDDRISVSPVATTLEGAGRSLFSVYSAASGDGSSRKAIRDSLTALGMMTGLPLGQIGKPLGYAADVAEGRQQPQTPVDLVQGLLSGRDGTGR